MNEIVVFLYLIGANMMKASVFLFPILLFCSLALRSQSEDIAMADLLKSEPAIQGRPEYLNSPFVTAGDRLYLVGHQNGSFPELGWHIPGEMGGIWDHPIKLMDGFHVSLHFNDSIFSLDQAHRFVNHPCANSHHFSVGDTNLQVIRSQFVPDGKEGLLVQYQISNSSSKEAQLELEFTGHSDLRPTWLGERTGMRDGEDQAQYLKHSGSWLIRDADNPWYVVFGSTVTPVSQGEEDSRYTGKGVSRSLRYSLALAPGETRNLTFTIAGSYTDREQALATYEDLQKNWPEALSKKKSRYAGLAAMSKLRIPDKDMEQAFEWLKYNCDWLVRTVPEIGSGISAGIPDYPWWFGVDSEYALKGYMAVGQTGPVYRTMHLLDSVSRAVNGNGRILHEMSTNGAVFNPGNINETPQFASLVREVFRWNGDLAFLNKYFPVVQRGLSWLMQENDENGNLFPDGFGMMEIHGMDSEMIDVAAYTQRAFSDAAEMAGILDKPTLEKEYSAIAQQLRERINQDFWSPSFASYADFIGTDEQALRLIEDAMIRADTLNKPWALEELKATASYIRNNPSKQARPFVLHHNWVVNTPLEMKIADSARAIQALNTAQKFTNPFGLFVTGIDRDEASGNDTGSFQGSKAFSYTGAVMTLPTGVMAIAENNYGRADKALDYLRRLTRGFSYALPGSMYEVSPDYGMMTQAWNIYSFAIPVVQQFFGIRPEAYRKEVEIRPQMPSTWENASLEDVKIADQSVSLFLKTEGENRSLRITREKPGWNIRLVLPAQEGREYHISEGDAQKVKQGNAVEYIVTTAAFEVEWGVSE